MSLQYTTCYVHVYLFFSTSYLDNGTIFEILQAIVMIQSNVYKIIHLTVMHNREIKRDSAKDFDNSFLF